MSDAPFRRATYDDLLALPEHLVGEIIDGELHVSPRPSLRQANARSTLGFDLGRFHRGGEDRPGGWWILFEPELHLGEDVLVPDLAGWRRDRLPRLPDTAACEVVPDWVCEVISPSSARHDRLRKMAAYARYGVAHAWLVDPVARLVEVYHLREGHWVQLTVATGGEQRLPPFEAVPLDPSAWWLPDEEPGGG